MTQRVQLTGPYYPTASRIARLFPSVRRLERRVKESADYAERVRAELGHAHCPRCEWGQMDTPTRQVVAQIHLHPSDPNCVASCGTVAGQAAATGGGLHIRFECRKCGNVWVVRPAHISQGPEDESVVDMDKWRGLLEQGQRAIDSTATGTEGV